MQDLELAFVPQWARTPPGRNPYEEAGGGGRGFDRGPRERDRDRERGPGRDRREGRDRRDRPARRERDGGRGGPRRDTGGRPERHADREGFSRPDFRRRGPPGPPPPRLPIQVSFLPDRQRLGLVVSDLHESRRAYRLDELASLFLSHPDSHAVKLEVRARGPEDNELRLYQCRACHAVFLDRSAALAHARRKHLDLYFDIEQVEQEAPAGNFTCVARCGYTGRLLGPPNHHSYAERVASLHAEQFPHLTLDEYRRRIDMVRDPDLIERWKQESRTSMRYRTRVKEGETPLDLTREKAEAHFLRHHADDLIVPGRRFVVPAPVTRETEEADLKGLLHRAWASEQRRPFTLLLALRPALKHMRLHLFRANDQATFVSSVKPNPVAPDQTIESIAEVLQYLNGNPGCTRQQLIEALRPGKDPAAPEVAAVISPLRWLVERGHVIEFSNGTLAVPRLPVAKPDLAPPPSGPPEQKPEAAG